MEIDFPEMGYYSVPQRGYKHGFSSDHRLYKSGPSLCDGLWTATGEP